VGTSKVTGSVLEQLSASMILRACCRADLRIRHGKRLSPSLRNLCIAKAECRT
jgi:hypothetical protein